MVRDRGSKGMDGCPLTDSSGSDGGRMIEAAAAVTAKTVTMVEGTVMIEAAAADGISEGTLVCK
jgi:hypothetical protein